MGTVAGCELDRFNHLHSSANLEKAATASESFDAVRSKRTGLPARVLANLETQQALRSTVGAASVAFSDQVNLLIVDGIDWDGLRYETYRQLGYRELDYVRLLQASIARTDLLPMDTRDEFARRASTLATASRRVGQGLSGRPGIARGLANAVAQQSLDLLAGFPGANPQVLLPDVDRDRVAASAADVTENDFASVLGWTRAGLTGTLTIQFRAAGVPNPDTEAARVAAALVAPATKAEVAAVAVPLEVSTAGEAIDKRLALIAKAAKVYEVLVAGERVKVAFFKKAQADLAKKARADFPASTQTGEKAPATPGGGTAAGTSAVPTTGGTAAAPTGPAAGMAAATPPSEPEDNVDRVLKLLFDVRSTIASSWKNQAERALYLAHATELQRLLVTAAEQSRDPASVYALVPLTGAGLDDDDLSTLDGYVKAIEAAFGRNAAEQDAIKAFLKATGPDDEVRSAISDFDRAWNEAKALLGSSERVDLPSVLATVVKTTDRLSLELNIVKSKRTAELAAALNGPVNALIASARGGEPSPEDAKAVITALFGGKTTRVLDNGIKVVLSKEVTSEIAKAIGEAASQDAAASKRVVDFVAGIYALHQQVHEENVRHFLALSTIAAAELERWSTNAAVLQEVEGLTGDGGRLVADSPSAGPRVQRTATVIPTLRALAVDADAALTSRAADADARAARLADAFQAVQGFQLVTSVNARRANDQSIALIGEVDTHAVHLDNILTAGVELEIRHGLDEVVAFHATGITDKDLQLVISVIQSGLLAWIGEQQ